MRFKSYTQKSTKWLFAILSLVLGVFVYASIDRTVYVIETLIVVPGSVISDSWIGSENILIGDLNEDSLYQDFSLTNSAYLDLEAISPKVIPVNLPSLAPESSDDSVDSSVDVNLDSIETENSDSDPAELPLGESESTTPEPTPTPEPAPAPAPTTEAESVSSRNIDFLNFNFFAKVKTRFPLAQEIIDTPISPATEIVEPDPELIETVPEATPESEVVEEEIEIINDSDLSDDSVTEIENINDEIIEADEISEVGQATTTDGEVSTEVDSVYVQPTIEEACGTDPDCKLYSNIFTSFSMPEFESGTFISSAQIRMSLAAKTKSNPGDGPQRFVVEYKYDEVSSWEVATVIDIDDEISNSINGGHFLISLEKPSNQSQLSNLQVRLSYQGNISYLERAYVEGLWLEVNSAKFYEETDPDFLSGAIDYDRELEAPKFHELNNADIDPAMSELPSFTLSYSPQENFLIRALTALFSENQYKVDSVRVIDSRGEVMTVPINVEYYEDKTWTLQFMEQPQKMVPGKYRVELVIDENETLYADSFEFYWGVLAVNTTKSMYFPGEDVTLNLAALTDKGDTICDANLVLKVVDPNNAIHELPVEQSGACGKNNVTDIPDYLAYYKDADALGRYTIQLQHLNRDGEVVHSIQDHFEVREYIPFDIERTAPTRIYPPAPYTVTLNITANREFTGDIVERVPRGFIFEDTGGAEVTTLPDATLLTWKDVIMEEGAELQLTYIFDAPDITPYMFLLGPLDMDGFKELRQWQIASDALGAVARLTATQTLSGANLNNSASQLLWSTSTLDNFYYAHATSTNPERLVIRKSGDYLVALTLPLERTDTNARRTRIGAEVRVNGVVVPQGVGRSAMMIIANNQNESSNNLHFLLTDLQANDYVEVFTEALTTIVAGDIVNITGQATLYVEFIAPSAGVFSATATSTTNSVNNLNASTSFPLRWTETRQDTGFVHSDTINPENIIISDPGAYMVYVNLPITSNVANVSPKGRVLLDGAEVPTGQFMQGFLRGPLPGLAENDTRSSIQWSGVVVSTSSNQVLSITTLQEATAGTTTVPTGFTGSIFVQKLPVEDIIYLRGNRLVSGTDWNVATKSAIQWNNQQIIDSVVYSHSTTTNNHQITLSEGGDYVLVFNDALTAAGGWNNVRVTVEVNGVEVTGAQTKSNMISNTSNLHRESSSALVYQLAGVTAGQIVTVSAVREGNTTVHTAITDASLLLWKKAELNLRAEVNASFGTPFDNIRFASTTPNFLFTASDPDGASRIEYEFSISTSSSFTSSVIRNSGIDSGFTNTASTSAISPYTENQQIRFQLSLGDALSNNTIYYWRVRANDVTGSGQYGDWSTTQSLTVDLAASTPSWYQSKGQQFSTNSLVNILADNEDSLVVDADPPSDVLMVYGEGTTQTPRYRLWDGAAWASEKSAISVGATINFIKSEAAPSRDEYAMVTLNSSNQTHAQIYSESTGAWSSLTQLSTVALNTARGVAVTYESISGDAIAVSCDGNNAVYRIWNGTSWSATSTITLAKATACYQLELTANPASDEIILVAMHQRTGNPDNEALVWDGSSWSNSVTFGISNSDTLQSIQLSYNRVGTQAVVAVDYSNSFQYTIWDGLAWTTPALEPVGARKYAGEMVASPYSDDIALCFVDSSASRRIQSIIWTGSSWNGGTILSTDGNESSGKPVDCTYETAPGRTGNLLVTYADRTQPRYRFFDGTTWSAEATMVSLGRVPVIQTVIAADGLLVSNLIKRDVPRSIYGSQFNGTTWSNEVELESTASHISTIPREVFWLSPKRNQFNEGTATTFPINFSAVPGRANWGDVIFSTTEPLGTDVKIRLKYTASTACDTYIPNGALAGNDTGFDVTQQPINIFGLSTTTYSSICLEANLTTSGNSSAALEEWQLTWERQPRLAQNNYRWFTNGSFLTPTDPWPLGTEDVDENESLSSDEAIDIGQTIRLRTSILGSNVNLPQFEEIFKLQFAAGNICSPNLNWTDVGAVGSTTAVWRGSANTIVGSDWLDASWTRRLKITVNDSLVSGAQTDFPVYVNLDDLPDSFFTSVQADGDDVRVTVADGISEVPFELVSINTIARTGELHFKGNLASTTDTEFFLYYGNPAASAYSVSATFGRNNVWTNGFEAVYHLQTSPASNMTDSTSNNRTLTTNGGMTIVNSTSSVLGQGVDFDGINDRLTNAGFTWPNASNTVTVTAWNNVTTAETKTSNLFGFTETGGQRLAAHAPWSDANLYWDFGAPGVPGRISTSYSAYRNKWTYVGMVSQGASGAAMRIHLDGALILSGTPSDPNQTLTGFSLGSNNPAGGVHHDGRIDEFRIASVARPTSWLTTEYNNQSNPIAFYVLSAEEQVGNGQNIPTTLLSTSDNPETYVEENPTRENQQALNIGYESEWDFVLQNNAAAANTNYCFRMVYENGTLLSDYTRYPRLITNAPPLAPTLITPFDNERLVSTTPWFDFAADDDLGNDVSYEIEVSSDISFASPEIRRESNASFSQFTNLAQPSQRGLYTAGQTIRFVPTTLLANGTTYFWRVRARDDAGSGQYGNWSQINSVTVTTSVVVSTWYQDLAEQFDTNELDNAVANYSGDDIRINTGGTAATTTSTEIDFNKGTIGNAWGDFSFTNTGAGTIRYRVEYKVSGNEFALVPNSVLTGNSAGFTASPIDLSALDPVLYRVLRLQAVHSGTDTNPRHQNWQVQWAETIEVPSLVSLFDNAKTSDTTPTLSFSTTDPQSDDIEYEIQLATTNTFTSSTTFNSQSSAGFLNQITPADTSPFNNGERVSYTPQTALNNNTTYWWRVRAKDPAGVSVWSKYSEPFSFTVNTAQVVPAWYQTVGEQFLTNTTNDIEGTPTSARITSVISGVLTVFGQGTEISPRYQTWNGNSWSNLASAGIIGAPARWVRTKAAPLRPEYALGVQATNQEVTLQIYNSESDSWGNLTTLVDSIPSADVRRRAFDISYETDSSRLMAVACEGNNAVYRTWNGTSWSATSSISLSTGGTCQWVTLTSDPTSNEIVAGFHKVTAGNPDFEAQVWNGSAWGNSTSFADSVSNSFDSVAVTYSSDGSQAMLVVNNNTANSFRYSVWDGSSWSTNLTEPLTRRFYWGNLAADPNSDNLALCYVTDTAAGLTYAGVKVWDGAAWGVATNLTTDSNNVSGRAIDCTYETTSGRTGNLMVTYSDTTNARYQISTSSPDVFEGEQTLDTIEDSWTVTNTRGADGTIHTVFFDDVNDRYEHSRWNGTAWTAREQFSTNPSVIGTPFDGSLDMAAQIFPSFNSGSIRSDTIDFADGGSPRWQEINWDDTTPGSSVIEYQVFYESAPDVFTLVPDIEIPSNSSGLTNSPIDISSLDPLVYTKLQLEAQFICSSAICPTLNEWAVEWSEGISVSGLAFTYDQMTALASGTIAVAVNGVLQVGKTAEISSAFGTQKAVFNTVGTTTFAVPAGVTELTVKAWGAGGAGGGGGISRIGASGGGGGFVQGTFTTTPVENLTVRVGGAGGPGLFGVPAGAGGGGGLSGLYRSSTPLAISGAGGGAGGGGGGIGYAGVGEACGVINGTCEPKLPVNIETDDVLIAVAHSFTGTLDHTCTSAGCGGWTEFSSSTNSNGRLTVWWKRQGSIDSLLPPIFNASANAFTARIWAFRGVAKSGNPFDQITTNAVQAANTLYTGSNITSTVPNTMMVFVGGSIDDNTWGTAAGSCNVPSGVETDFYTATDLSNDNSIFLCFDGTPQNSVGSLGIPTINQATLGGDAGRHFGFNLRPETSAYLPAAGIGGVGGGLLGGNGGASDSATSFTATGGSTTDLNGYRFHTFNSSGTFETFSSSRAIETMIVGGGAGGGGYRYGGGGGGAGGIRFMSSLLAPNSYSVTVGAGGAGGDNTSATSTGNGQNGGDTTFASTTALGGGGGQRGDRPNDGSTGVSGASGGGGGSSNVNAISHAGGSGTTTQGNLGGSGVNSNAVNSQSGGGGGGAWLAGINGTTVLGGAGGTGRDMSGWFGTGVGASGWFGGGGGGGKRNTGSAGAGGTGGGGAGNVGDNNGVTATANTGGGGGGAGGNTVTQFGGGGGSGVVIVRYRLPLLGGLGGTQSTGGTGSGSSTNGSAFAGGAGDSGVGGGAGGAGGSLSGGAGGAGRGATAEAGGGGAGSGYYGGGGGARGVDAVFSGAGGGGGSSYVVPAATATTTSSGSGTMSGNSGDSDYAGGAGSGGLGGALSTDGAAGLPGRVVLSWTGSTTPGVWNIPNVSVAAGDVVTVFIVGANGDKEAVAVTKYDGTGDISDVRLSERHLTLGSEDNPTITNADIELYKNTDNEDIFFDVTAGNALNLCVESTCGDAGLTILASTTYTPGANGSVIKFNNYGTFNPATSTLRVGGLWGQFGIFNPSQSTIIFTATSSTFTVDNASTTLFFNNVTFGEGSGNAAWTISKPLQVNGNLGINFGSLARAIHPVTINGNLSLGVNGNMTGLATTTFAGSGSNTWGDAKSATSSTNIGYVVIDGIAKTITLAGNVGSETVTIGADDTLNSSGSGFNINVVRNWTNNNAFIPQSGTVTFVGTSTGAINRGVSAFNNLSFTGVGGNWSFSTSTLALNGSMTIATGTVTLPTGTTTIGASFLNTGGTFLHNNGEVRMTSNSGGRTITQRGTAFLNAFYDLVFSGTGGWAYSEANATTSRQFRIQSGAVTFPTGTLTVGGDFSLTGSGSFLHNSGEVILLVQDSNVVQTNGSNFNNLRTRGTSMGSWYNVLWANRLPIVVNSSQVPTTVTDFPVYVNLANLPASFFTAVQAGGTDIRITTSDGITEVPYELVTINTGTQTGELHFKAPSVSSTTNTTFHIYYGNASAPAYAATSTFGRNNVWTNGYEAVYHLGTSPAATMVDSTVNGRNLTSAGGMGVGNSVSGVLGNGVDFDGINDSLNDTGFAWANATNTITVTAWNNVTTAETKTSNLFGFANSAGQRVAAHGPWSDAVLYWDFGPAAVPGRVSTSYTAYRNKWTHVGLVSQGASGSTMSIHLDGALITSGSPNDPNVTLTGFNLGSGHGGFHDGRIDEFRIASVARTGGWISTERNNQASTTAFYSVSAVQNRTVRTFMDINATILSNFTLDIGGDSVFPTGVLSVGGSFDNNAIFTSNSGTVRFNSTTGAETIAVGSSTFATLEFNNAGGDFTIIENATATVAINLTNASQFTLQSGRTLAALGNFNNAANGANTTWTGSTLLFTSGTSTNLNSKLHAGDVYGTLLSASNTVSRMWNSSADNYSTVGTTSAIYSQDHTGVDGDLNIYGNYTRTTGTEFWSYGTDFDGVTLGTSSVRQANVRVASSSLISFISSSLNMVGSAAASTTIDSLAGAFALNASNTTITAEHFRVAGTNASGTQIVSSSTLATFRDGFFTVIPGRTGITVDTRTVNTNPAAQFFRIGFATTTAGTATNVTMMGTSSSFIWFREGTGNLYGEAFDGTDANPGSIRFDDSSNSITISGIVYSDDGVTPLGSPTCNGTTPNVRVVVNSGSYTASTTCNAVTGAYTLTGVNYVGDPKITVYLNTNGGVAGTVVTKTPTANITNMHIYANRVITRHQDVAPLTIADMTSFDFNSDSDIKYIATTTGSTTLRVLASNSLFVFASTTFAPGGNVSLLGNASSSPVEGTLQLGAAATFTASGTETHTLAGRLVMATTSILTSASSTFVFNATTTGKSITGVNPITFHNLNFNGAGGGWNISAPLNVLGDMNVSTGTVTGTSDINIINGSLQGNGLLSLGSGTTTLSRTNTLGGTTAWSFNNLILGNGSTVGTTTPAGTATTTISGRLTIANAHFLDAGSSVWDLAGTGTVLVSNGNLLVGTSLFRFSGAGATVPSMTYYNLLLSAGIASPTYTSTGSGILVLNNLTVGGGTNSTFDLNTNDTILEVRGNTNITASGTIGASNSALLNLLGSWTNAGSFIGNSGTTTFAGTGTTNINAGNSSFSNVLINGTGDFTFANNATTTGNLVLTNHNNFTVSPGQTLAVGGQFTNTLAGAATTWTGSTLALFGTGTYSINSSSTNDIYDTLNVRSGTQVRLWNSSASAYNVATTGSLYSQDHTNVTGDLYVWGQLIRSTGSDHWSYATDFDGTNLSGGSERIANVYMASGTTALWQGGSLSVIGSSSASSTVQNQGTGTYGITFGTGATIDWNGATIRNTGASGVVFAGAPTVTDFSRTDHLVQINGGSAITVGGTAINANQAKNFTNNVFNQSGASSPVNVTATGTAVSSWRFTNHIGNIAGEDFDNDPTGDPGYLVWDNSAALITVAGNVYSNEVGGVSAVCDGSTNNIRLVVAGLTAYDTTCNAGTGVYSIASVAFSPLDTLTLYINGETPKAANVSIAPISSISNMHLYENRIVVRHENTNPITIADLAVWDSSDDSDIPFTAVDAATDTLTLPADRKLIVWTGKTFAPGGNVTLSGGGGGADYDGTLEAQTNAVLRAFGTESHSVGGNVIFNTGASLAAASSTINLTTSAAARTFDINASTVHNLNVSGSGSLTMTDITLNLTGSYTQSAGAVTFVTATTTVGAAFNVTGGSFVSNGAPLVFNASSSSHTVRFNNTSVGPLYFNGPATWSMTDTNATSTGRIRIVGGTVTLPSGNLAVGGSFEKISGTLNHNTSDLIMTSNSNATITASTSDLHAVRFTGGGNYSITDSNITFLNDFEVASGTVKLASSTTSVGGSFTATGGTFNNATGTVLLNSSVGGRTINPGSSAFYNLQIGAPSGGYTLFSATTTNNFTIANANILTVNSGATVTVGGVFTNSVGGVATTWTGTTLRLVNGGSYSINSKANSGDVYSTLLLGANTKIKSWFSSAATTTLSASSSFYSQDHANADGQLYIFGDLNLATSTEYWSYANDFDGAVLVGGSRRQARVFMAQNSTTTVTTGSLQVIGELTNKTTIQNQATGTYSMKVSGGTLNADHYEFRHLDINGLQLSELSTITNLANGYYDLAVNTGSLITLSSTTLNANPSKIFNNVGFTATTGRSGNNINLIGETANAWRFTSNYGNLSGEGFDIDGIDACGSIRFDNSSCLLTEQTQVRWRNDDGGEGAPTSEWFDQGFEHRKRIRIDNDDAQSYASTAIKVAITYDSDMRSNFEDLRFTSDDGLTTIPYWIDRYTASTDAVVWVRVPNIPAASITAVQMYYGSSTAPSLSSGSATFNAFDDFEDNNITEYSGDTGLFQTDSTPVYGGGYALEASNKTGRTTNGLYRTSQTVAQGQIIRWMQYVSTDGDDACTLFGFQSVSNNFGLCLQRFGVDRMLLVKNIKDNDSSGTVLASTTVTYATGWYEVEVDWRTNNSLTAYLYNPSGSLVASTTVTDSSYSSGGYGFSFWVNNGSWDSFTSRATGPRRPSVYVGAEQTFGGASWRSALNAAGSALPGDTVRLRVGIENSGLDIIDQELRLDYALKGAAPTCESVSSVSYAPVPPQATCGTSPVCMATSSSVINGGASTDLLAGTDGEFMVGKIVSSPSNKTTLLDIDQGFYTELEYVISPTVNATDALCLRVTNDGNELDFYNTVAELSLQFDPSFGAITLNDGLDISLTPGTTTPVTVSGTVTDFNGFSDMVRATTTVYRSGAGSACTPDNNNCYVATTENNQCTFTACSGNSCTLSCQVDVFFHADPTDVLPYEGQEWLAYSEVEDTSSSYDFASAPGVELITLRALSVDSLINYGSLEGNTDTGSFNPTTKVINLGNVPIDVDVEGTDLSDGNSSVIAADQQKVATSTFTYNSCVSCQDLSTSTPVVLDINLSKPVIETPPVETDVYWGIFIPFSASNAAHSGTNIFTPIGVN